MRPVSVAIPPIVPDGLLWSVSGNGANTVLTLTWNDNSINETEFLVQRYDGTTWTDIGSVFSPLDQLNTHGVRSLDDTSFRWNNTSYAYRVVAKNTLGYGGQYMSMTVQSVSPQVAVINPPTNLSAFLRAGPVIGLNWMDNALNETGFVVQRSTDGVTFGQIGTAPARNNTGFVSFVDPAITLGTTYFYRVATVNALGTSAYSNVAIITVAIPADPANLQATAVRQGNNERVTLTWIDNSNNEANFVIERALDIAFTNPVVVSVAADTTTYTTGNIPLQSYYFRIRAENVIGPSGLVNATPFPIGPAPLGLIRLYPVRMSHNPSQGY